MPPPAHEPTSADVGDGVRPALVPARVGGHVALDFANTVAWHAGDHPADRIGDYARLVAWARASDLLTPAEADALAGAAAAAPAQAAAAHRRAVAFREAFYRVASALARGGAAAPADLAVVRAAWADALGHATLAQPRAAAGDEAGRDAGREHDAPFVLTWPVGTSPVDDAAPLDVPRWRVAHAAGELLTAGPLDRLRECAGHPCGWLFVDRSRNRSRRWCDSADCGNRVRVREHHARRRAARPAA